MFLPIHSRVEIDDLLHGVIIQSGNDACIALAEGIAGNEGEFAQLMTKRARELGLTKSTFANSTGLPDPRAAHDLARARASSRSTSSTPIPNTTNITASGSSPGTRSASTTAIRCWP